jgi:hypothetical protein
MGAMVGNPSTPHLNVAHNDGRIIKVEVRQPKFERGTTTLCLACRVFLSFVSADRVQMTSALSSSLHEALLTMAMYTSSERGRAAVPLITSNATISPFPMSIVVKVGGVEVP